jgi:uncharacterized protein YdeI (YjbR/CyaY-like superfamily)
MATNDARIDAFIEKAPPFAQPILAHLRARIVANCPEIQETLKWGMPAFVYRGKILASMAAFKAHATFGFWHGALVTGQSVEGAMGSFGRLTSVSDLPVAAQLDTMIRKAVQLIDDNVPTQRQKREAAVRPAPLVPPAFQLALDANPAAAASFVGFPPGQQREYVDWIAEAKREETQAKRIGQAVEWLAQGKRRNWKYENC